MERPAETESSSQPRILLLSHRNVYEPEVWRSVSREFEGIIQDVDEVDLLAPRRGRWFEQRRNHAMRVGKFSRIIVNPGVQRVRLNKQYDVMFVICEKPSELLNISAIEGWKERCKTSICLLTDFFQRDIPKYKSSIEVLRGFDHVLFFTVGIEAFKGVLPGTVDYLAPGIDAIRFCPYPSPPIRSIDVLSIGRRSSETHQALLRMARSQEIFYDYDTIKSLGAYDIEEHRFLLANKAKRSRYFIVNPGYRDKLKETGGQSEFGPRYFEGAAAGAILIGERPDNREFDRLFNWKDAVVHLPFGSQNIGELIRELDKDPDRQAAIRRNNITHSLLSHDWAYRWEYVLALGGLQPSRKLVERKQLLGSLAAQIERSLSN